MNLIDNKLQIINKLITKIINLINQIGYGFSAQILLTTLRTFVECVIMKIYLDENKLDFDNSSLIKSIETLKNKKEYKQLFNFHHKLQSSVSHYIHDEHESIGLLSSYYEDLIELKLLCQKLFNIEILNNLSSLTNAETNDSYVLYKQIYNILISNDLNFKPEFNDRYYIINKKTILINNQIIYEITFALANDKVNKSDYMIGYTLHNIPNNYAIKLGFIQTTVNLFKAKIPVLNIINWEISIRHCEIKNLSILLGIQLGFSDYDKDLYKLNSYLTETNITLLDILDYKKDDYDLLKLNISKNKSSIIIKILDKCRLISNNNSNGKNIIRYLMYRLRNNVIKNQTCETESNFLSNLFLDKKCIPFENMPCCTSLRLHNTSKNDIYNCIEIDNREHEFFANKLQYLINYRKNIFIPIIELINDIDINSLIQSYNSLVRQYQPRRIIRILYNKYIYISEYKDDLIRILKILNQTNLTDSINHKSELLSFIKKFSADNDNKEKLDLISKFYSNSNIAVVYGAAGTGKSYLITLYSKIYNNYKKLYLTTTHSALNNLKQRTELDGNSLYVTIDSFISPKHTEVDFDLLIIDECSCISNRNMKKLLEKANYKCLLIVGDDNQIESVNFGNWFYILKKVLPDSKLFELKIQHRSSIKNIYDLWNKTIIKDRVYEHINLYDFSCNLKQIFKDKYNPNEIILCLNYHGLYGINNLNYYFQSLNKSKSFMWNSKIYKINDPIIFNDNLRFGGVLYNSLKGKIVNINIDNDIITFELIVFRSISDEEAENKNFQLLNSSKNQSTIKFTVIKSNNNYDIYKKNHIVPFNIAYAISIHKAQGLEFDTVKIVFSDDLPDNITYNIFYTAITRAKKCLKIYWSPETSAKLMKNLTCYDYSRDAGLINNLLYSKDEINN